MPKPTHILLLLGAALLLQAACSTSLPIFSRPEGAEVVMSHPTRTNTTPRALGQTPLLLQEQAWLWTRHTLTITKRGYRPETIEIKPEPKLVNTFGCCLMGCIGWPLVLMSEYEGEVVVNLEPLYKEMPDELTHAPQAPAPLLEDGPRLSFRD